VLVDLRLDGLRELPQDLNEAGRLRVCSDNDLTVTGDRVAEDRF
jgi:hypothetical protein